MDSAKKGTLEYANAAQEYDAALRNLLVPFEEWVRRWGTIVSRWQVCEVRY